MRISITIQMQIKIAYQTLYGWLQKTNGANILTWIESGDLVVAHLSSKEVLLRGPFAFDSCRSQNSESLPAFSLCVLISQEPLAYIVSDLIAMDI